MDLEGMGSGEFLKLTSQRTTFQDFKIFCMTKVYFSSLVAIDHNHVAFSLIVIQGAYINSLSLKQNERHFILILYIIQRI